MSALRVTDGTIWNARIVTPSAVLHNGWVRVRNATIEALGQGEPPTNYTKPASSDATSPKLADANGAWLFPGFADMHCHGGGGGSFTHPDATSIARAIAFHRANGTRSLVASTVSSPHQHLLDTCRELAGFVERKELAGIHLEGPYLSVAKCGAQNPKYLRRPSIVELTELWEASNQSIKQITIAPELPGALDAITWMTAHNIIPAVGHTNADAETVGRAVDVGARVGTHICNAMPELHHRYPTATSALIDDERVTLELIADGVHVSPEIVRLIAARTTPTNRLTLITDAIAVAGLGDVAFTLGDLPAQVNNGVARLADGTIAGSTLTMRQAIENALAFGLDPVSVSHAAATTPARLLGLADHHIAVGAIAEFALISM